MKHFLLSLAVALLASFPARAQSDLRPDAKLVFAKGMSAVQQQLWEMAIKYFSDSSIPNDYPPRLFNLGLAHAKAGHDLAGMICLRAYMDVAPQAENANAVREEILRLEVATEAQVQEVLSNALSIAKSSRDTKVKGDMDYEKRTVTLTLTAAAQAASGDLDGAKDALSLRGRNDKDYPYFHAILNYAQTLSDAGEIDHLKEFIRTEGVDAIKVSPILSSDDLKSLLLQKDTGWSTMSSNLASFGDAVRAREAVNQIVDPQTRALFSNLSLNNFKWSSYCLGSTREMEYTTIAFNLSSKLKSFQGYGPFQAFFATTDVAGRLGEGLVKFRGYETLEKRYRKQSQ